MEETNNIASNRATKIYSSTLGILVGLAGIEHGFLEILQGNVRPDGLMIDAIGPEQRLWEYATETALTIVPNFLLTGILSVVLGVLVIIWAYAYIDKKYGAVVFLFLLIALFLVGGGFAPIFLTLLAFIAALRINKPLHFWSSRVPSRVRSFFARLWPWTLIISVISFVVAVEIAIFGEPFVGLVGAESAYSLQFLLGLTMLVLAIVALPAANAYDARNLNELSD